MAKERSSKGASELRKRAEKILAEDPHAIRTIAPADIQKLIHELNVHQIELEMQNEELRHVQLELQEARDKYLNLYDFAPTGYFILDYNSLIVDVNLVGSELLGSEKHRLIGAQFTASISLDYQDAFYFHRREVLKTGIKGNCELEMLKADGTLFQAQLTSMAIPEKDGNINQCRTAVIDITERKQAEESLRRSEERYSILVEQNNDAIIVIQDGLIKFASSQKSTEMTGFSLDEILGKPFLNFVAPEGRGSVADRYKKRIAGEEVPNRYEIEILHKDGRKIPVEVSASVIEYEGKLADMIVLRDISERKRAEEALRESEERYRTLFESAAEAIIIADIETKKLQYVNPAACTMLGYSQEELARMSISAIHPKTSLEYVFAEFGAQSRGEKTLTNLPCLKKDGTIIYVDINATKAIIDGRACNVGFFTDITERKQVEEALRRSEQRYRELAESISDVFFAMNGELRFTYWNKASEKLTGVLAKDALGKHAYDIFPDMKATGKVEAEEVYLKTIETKQSQQFVTEYHLGGKDFVFEVTAYPSQDGISAFVKDVTERKKMQEQLVMQDRLASIGQLASGIAHEINNPLTSILGFSQVILKGQLPDDIRADLKIICSEAERTANIVKGLLTFARQHPLLREQVNINKAIDSVLDLRAYEMRANNIEVIKHFGELPEIIADNFQMQQVFLNIIVNAEYFMIEAHKRGTLTVTTERLADVVRIAVSDDGPGIAEEQKKRLFNPFTTTKPVGKGTGLGLSICHGIVTEHSGRIYAESESGKGATFVVELPISQ